MKRDRKDGWSQFLVAMMRLYRFAQATPRWDRIDPSAIAEMTASNDAFQRSVPLLGALALAIVPRRETAGRRSGQASNAW